MTECTACGRIVKWTEVRYVTPPWPNMWKAQGAVPFHERCSRALIEYEVVFNGPEELAGMLPPGTILGDEARRILAEREQR